MIRLLDPYWLFLGVPLAVALLLWPPASWLQRVLRVASVTLLLLALAGLTLKLPSRAGTVVVVVDRSASMPEDATQRQFEAVDLIQKRMGSSDLLAVVSFGQEAGVDRLPSPGNFAGFPSLVDPGGSDLGAGLEKALELIPEGSPGRIFVVSDGRWTGRDPANAVARAAARQIAIDYRLLERPRADDLAIERLDAPASVAPGEAFLITAWVRSPRPMEVKYELLDRDRPIAAGTQRVVTGRNRLTFRDRAHEAGNHAYSLRLVGTGADPIPGNNEAKLLVGVSGAKPILHVTQSANSGLAALLKKSGLNLRVANPADCRWTLEDLARYSAVVLENVPASQLKHQGAATLSAWVRQTGTGLFMTGGKDSYATGGYHESPLANILPVSLDLRQDHRKQSVALVVVLDRSGSMAAPVADGRVKMDLANAGTVAAFEMLGPGDEFGCLAVDTKPHTIAEFGPVGSKGATISKIRRITSEGGGIYVYDALQAAATMIAGSKATTKHIVLFSDASDSEKPDDYKTLLGKMTQNGITVSVIGLGKSTNPDGPLLEDIARVGKGRCFFTDKAEELPRLFVQETFVVARKTFLDEPTPVQETSGLSQLTGRPLGLDLKLGGYNLCRLKPEAIQGGVTIDDYSAPVVASWQAGMGRVVCFTGEADGKYAGELPSWERAGEFYASLVRWAAGLQTPLPRDMMPRLEVRNGIALIELHLDPQRNKEPFSGLPQAILLRAEPGQQPTPERRPLRWSGPDLLSLEVPLTGTQTMLTTLEVPGYRPVTLSPVCLPYASELRPDSATNGVAVLDRLARATGGKERIDLSVIWSDMPRKPRVFEATPWLLCVAMVLILLEVFERRTGLLSRPGWLRLSSKEDRQARRRWFAGWWKSKPQTPVAVVKTPVVEKPTENISPQPSLSNTDMMEALRKARERTRARLD